MLRNMPGILKLFFSLVIVVVGYLVLYELFLLGAKLINDPLDEAILLALQPDHYVPVLDECMVFLTHFSVYLFSITTITWLITNLIVRKSEKLANIASYVWKVFAVVLAIYHISGIWISSKGIFWWRPHEYRSVFIILSVVSFLVFWFGSKTWTQWDYLERKRWTRVFWVTLVSVFFTNYLGENNIKRTVGRPRPLHEKYEPWNKHVRVIKDEVVKASPSYISGHASSLFALLTPSIWAVRKKRVKVALTSWGAIHAYTRIYTAAHFPYCAFMGSLFGFLIGTLCYWAFWWCLNPKKCVVSPQPISAKST
ncbi:MAG TPA: phosphatase PAP2 family protein [Candidatus Hydrogenedens sp.]|nr:phosphatase PAP2 family protein [Candidatus Hydrogenedens sp.]HOL19217.1 phosphatase PAP2 family protein [Candidatus Hydrogenedens sp.]HPP58432.1 phosphatase PAP2 family protein [Candidatus Hydrogenedens sp.]